VTERPPDPPRRGRRPARPPALRRRGAVGTGVLLALLSPATSAAALAAAGRAQAAAAAADSGAGTALARGVADLAQWLDGLSPAAKAVALGAATLVSEDLTTIFAGLLVARGELSFATALLGCTLGIWVGDGLLWLLGRTLGRRVVRLPVLRRLVAPWQLARAERWFERQGLRVVVVSRFLPGSRLPAFFAAGLLGSRARWFLGWALLAALLWTPLLILVAAEAQPRIESLVESVAALRGAWSLVPPLVSVLVLLGVLRSLEMLTDWRARALFRARWTRRLHWEFWSPWVFYVPAFLWYMALALRHRSLTLPTVANPGMDAGGFIGESKSAILDDLVAGRPEAQACVVRTLALAPLSRTDAGARAAALDAWMSAHGMRYPIVLKPDVGQRGSGVRKVGTPAEAHAYLASVPVALVAQQYAPGPHELGVFWVRPPGAAQGRLFSVTEKFFPEVVGDGEHCLEDLILLHPRATLMAGTFFRRHGDLLGWVPGPGARFPLVTSGNHCQGALFKDGGRLATDALRARLDMLADGHPGLHVGRFDLRAPDLDAVARGKGFLVVELNGATAEATHIYDPAYGPWKGPLVAWSTLCRQWTLIFAIAARNRAAGHRPLGPRALVRRLLAFRRAARAHPPAS
jgi:membrane protein DedA with SNARE-associated domain